MALPDDFAKLRLDTGYLLELEGLWRARDEPVAASRRRRQRNRALDRCGSRCRRHTTRGREGNRAGARGQRDDQLSKCKSHDQRICAPCGDSLRRGQSPGKIQMLAPRPLLAVLADAGGETMAAGGHVEIHHAQPGGIEQITQVVYAPGKNSADAEKALVSPGDTVHVPRAGVIYVLGAVNRPGGYLMVNGGTLDLPQAVALAMGVSPVGSSKSVVVVRKRDGQIGEIHLRLDEMQRGKAEVFALTDGDMVYVPTNKIKSGTH